MHVPEPMLVRNTSPQGLGRALTGHVLGEPERRGKWVLVPTDGRSSLLLHFGMTGSVRWAARDDPDHEPGDYDYVQLDLGDGILSLHMPRKLGGAYLAASDDDRLEATGELGPDAWGLDAATLQERLGDGRGALKAALQDQSRVAGLGNLLSDELLWQTCLHPEQVPAELDDAAWPRMADALERILERGVELGHVPAVEGLLLDVRGAEGAPCPRCGTPLAHASVSGRTAWWCPSCQPPP